LSELARVAPVSIGQRRAARSLAVALEHPAAVYVASLAPGSRRSTIGALRRAAKWFVGVYSHRPEVSPVGLLDWHLLTFGNMVALRSHLAETLSPATWVFVAKAMTLT